MDLPANRLAPRLTKKAFDERFADVKPAFTLDEALAESARCLFCYDAPCIQACPTGIDIPTFIKKIMTGNLKGAAKTIYDANVFGATCGRVCPVEQLCEGSCVMVQLEKKPIEIGRLQRFASDWAIENGVRLGGVGAPNGKSVACVGGGPSSLACAAELRRLGYAVTVYDAHAHPGGLNIYGCAPYKITFEDGLKEIQTILALGVTFVPHTRVGIDVSLSELEKKHDAIFLGIGLGESPNLDVPGEDLPGVVGAIEWIDRLRGNPTQTRVGRRVAVVGGGNTAVDAATNSRRAGAEQVHMIYRRSRADMSAYPYEQDLACRDEVIFHWNAQPVRVLGQRYVEGIELVRLRDAPKTDGKSRFEPIPGSNYTIEVDMVIKAIGQRQHEEWLSKIPGLKFRDRFLQVDEKTYQTGNPKYFAGGDCIGKGMEVVYAVSHGKKAARGIHQWLSSGKARR